MKNIMEMFSVAGKTAVVTGAGSGIGAEIAVNYASLGANVMLVDIDAARLEGQLERCEGFAGSCAAHACNVADEEQITELCKSVKERFGYPDILVNSHGISRRASADEVTPKQFDDVIQVNLRGVFLTTAMLGRMMLENGGGSIVNVSSIAAHVCMPNNVNYAAAKGGLESMTRAFAGEWAGRGMRVNAVAPGPCRTSFTETLYAQPGYLETLLKKIPRGQVSVPDELMGAILLFTSDAGINITGQTLIADGGFTII